MKLLEYISKYYDGNQSSFARSCNVSPSQVTQWVRKDFIVVDHVLYSPRRELEINLCKPQEVSMFFKKTKQLKEENTRLFDENSSLNKELMVYKDFFKTVYYYAGTYPVWKLLHEYSEAIHLNKNTEHVNDYLEKLVLAVEKVLIELHPEEIDSWKESLCNIRLYISDLEKK